MSITIEQFSHEKFPSDNTPPPSVLNIQVHGSCNANCVMCAYQRVRSERPGHEMSMDLFCKIIDQFTGCLGSRLIGLSLQCEPLLDSQLERRIEYIKNISSGIQVGISSNAILLDPLRFERLVDSGLNSLNVSLNAASRETFEKIYRTNGFEKTISNIEHVIQNKPSHLTVQLSSMLVSLNLAEMLAKPLIFEEAAKAGINITKGPVSNHCGNLENYDKIAVLKKHQSSRKKLFCHDLFEAAYILCNGDVIGCCSDWSRQYRLGNIAEQDFKAMWYNAQNTTRKRLMVTGDFSQCLPCRSCSQAWNITRNLDALRAESIAIDQHFSIPEFSESFQPS